MMIQKYLSPTAAFACLPALIRGFVSVCFCPMLSSVTRSRVK